MFLFSSQGTQGTQGTQARRARRHAGHAAPRNKCEACRALCYIGKYHEYHPNTHHTVTPCASSHHPAYISTLHSATPRTTHPSTLHLVRSRNTLLTLPSISHGLYLIIFSLFYLLGSIHLILFCFVLFCLFYSFHFISFHFISWKIEDLMDMRSRATPSTTRYSPLLFFIFPLLLLPYLHSLPSIFFVFA